MVLYLANQRTFATFATDAKNQNKHAVVVIISLQKKVFSFQKSSVCLLGRYVHVYVLEYVRTMVHVYTCTNITLSQKRLEIQALRCNGDTSGRCQHRRHHGILQLRFQLDSDVCSADLHHNPRKHVGLHAHQRLHRLP